MSKISEAFEKGEKDCSNGNFPDPSNYSVSSDEYKAYLEGYQLEQERVQKSGEVDDTAGENNSSQ